MLETGTEIRITRQAPAELLETLNIFVWPIWEKEVSRFPWHYDSDETCYFLAGEVTVTPQDGEPVTMGRGDLVTFPAGMDCVWEIHQAVRKHYEFA